MNFTTNEARRFVEGYGYWYAFDILLCHQSIPSTLWRLWIVSRLLKFEAKQNGTYRSLLYRTLDRVLG